MAGAEGELCSRCAAEVIEVVYMFLGVLQLAYLLIVEEQHRERKGGWI